MQQHWANGEGLFQGEKQSGAVICPCAREKKIPLWKIIIIKQYLKERGFPGGSVAKRRVFDTWVWQDPLEYELATHSNILAWKILWREEPGGLQSMGSQRVRHDWATTHTHTHTHTHAPKRELWAISEILRISINSTNGPDTKKWHCNRGLHKQGWEEEKRDPVLLVLL